MSVVRNGQVYVQGRLCDTCIFRKGNLMRLRPGRVDQMVRDALKNDSCIPCHELSGRRKAICRGFFNRHWRDVFPLRLAYAFKRLKFTEGK